MLMLRSPNGVSELGTEACFTSTRVNALLTHEHECVRVCSGAAGFGTAINQHLPVLSDPRMPQRDANLNNLSRTFLTSRSSHING